jgi:hypothetical protein
MFVRRTLLRSKAFFNRFSSQKPPKSSNVWLAGLGMIVIAVPLFYYGQKS